MNESLRHILREHAEAFIDSSKRAHRVMDPGPTLELPYGCSCGRAFATQRGRSGHISNALRRAA